MGCVLALLLPAAAAAQSSAEGFDTIDRQLKPGQDVVVTEFGGRRVKGRTPSPSERGRGSMSRFLRVRHIP